MCACVCVCVCPIAGLPWLCCALWMIWYIAIWYVTPTRGWAATHFWVPPTLPFPTFLSFSSHSSCAHRVRIQKDHCPKRAGLSSVGACTHDTNTHPLPHTFHSRQAGAGQEGRQRNLYSGVGIWHRVPSAVWAGRHRDMKAWEAGGSQQMQHCCVVVIRSLVFRDNPC